MSELEAQGENPLVQSESEQESPFPTSAGVQEASQDGEPPAEGAIGGAKSVGVGQGEGEGGGASDSTERIAKAVVVRCEDGHGSCAGGTPDGGEEGNDHDHDHDHSCSQEGHDHDHDHEVWTQADCLCFVLQQGCGLDHWKR